MVLSNQNSPLAVGEVAGFFCLFVLLFFYFYTSGLQLAIVFTVLMGKCGKEVAKKYGPLSGTKPGEYAPNSV